MKRLFRYQPTDFYKIHMTKPYTFPAAFIIIFLAFALPDASLYKADSPANVRKAISDMIDEDIKEDEILIVNFWGTWCQPCIGEIPDLNQIVEDYQNEKVRFIAFSDEHPDKLGMFNFRNYNNKRPDLIFNYEQVFGNLEVNRYIKSFETNKKGRAVPFHLLIKSDGTLGKVLPGASTSYNRIIREFIDGELDNISVATH
ncbi:redoxin domain-containing protein [Litoribacter ruber]|uniref:TlpA family protein disulfide reductase n=1 Tax=Litoribacter ruber TaxID=702568 RepID=UPI001BDA597D|nr:redoxin domain-containing protein [Litoribacter ruber]MBT0810108.1 redoxin domain-containing protein [Litoribacter ruber]